MKPNSNIEGGREGGEEDERPTEEDVVVAITDGVAAAVEELDQVAHLAVDIT